MDQRNVSLEQLDAKHAECALYQDQKTKGVMGFLPCVKGMPLRIKQTDPRNKSLLFRNRRCKLHGWKLHEEDVARPGKCSAQGMKLEYLPEELFPKLPNATWIWSADLGGGVIGIKPTLVTWHLDRN